MAGRGDAPGDAVTLLAPLVWLVAIVAGVAVVKVVWDARAARWREAAGDAGPASTPGPEGSCTACGSIDLEVLAPGVYRCRACGYEGGANRAAWERSQRQAEWASRPWPERIASARADVETALREVLSTDPDHDQPIDLFTVSAGTAYDNAASSLRGLGDDTALASAKVALLAAAAKVPDLGIPASDDDAWRPRGDEREAALYQRLARTAMARLDALAAAAPP